MRQLFCDGEMRGVTAAVEQAGVVEHGRRGTDGGKPATGGGLLLNQGTHAQIAPQVDHTRPARQKNEIIGLRDGFTQCGVGVHC